jgi:hypothetical protein
MHLAQHPEGVAQHPEGVAQHPEGVAQHPVGAKEGAAGRWLKVAWHAGRSAEHGAEARRRQMA